MDVKTAFLNGDIDEMIYIMQLGNFVLNESKSMVCKLKKSIYGLKQISRQWYHKFHQVITSYSFKADIVDDYVYHQLSGSKYIFLVLYVDDILLSSSDIDLLHEAKRFLTKNFEMKDLGEASFVLGIQTLRDHSQGILRLSQDNYISIVLNRFSMEDSKLGDIPIAKGDKFSLKQCPNNDFERNEMQNVCSSLYSPRHYLCGGSFGQVVDGIEKPLKIHCDYNSAVLYSNNNRSSTKSKEYEVQVGDR
ncbi:hypothetical protein CR513_18597, partial [Mucuna pruriens]